MPKSGSEDLCRNCGRCCHASVIVGEGRIRVPELHCKHLDMCSGKSRCKVYTTRHEVTDWCHPMAKSIENGVFPRNCPYVVEIEGYVGTAELPPAFYSLVEAELRAALVAGGMPEWVDALEWARYLS